MATSPFCDDRPASVQEAVRSVHVPTLARAVGLSEGLVRKIIIWLWLGITIDSIKRLTRRQDARAATRELCCIARAIGWTKSWRVTPETPHPNLRHHPTYLRLVSQHMGISTRDLRSIIELLLDGQTLRAVQCSSECPPGLLRLIAAGIGWRSGWRDFDQRQRLVGNLPRDVVRQMHAAKVPHREIARHAGVTEGDIRMAVRRSRRKRRLAAANT